MKTILKETACLSKKELQAYLNESIHDDDRYRIESHLIDCPLCNAAVEGFAQQYNFGEDEYLEKLETAIITKKEIVQNHSIIKTNFSLMNRIAAAVLLLLIAGASLLYWNSQKTERLFLSYYEGFELDNTTRGIANNAAEQNELNLGASAFSNQSFEKSIGHFNTYLKENPEHIATNYFKAMALLELGEYKEAIDYFSICSINDESYFEESTWHIALAYLQLKDVEQAKQFLKDLTKDEKSFYYKKAKELLGEL